MTRTPLVAALGGVVIGYILVSMYLMTPTAPRTETVFVYGTLMNPVARLYACRCKTPLQDAQLKNYQKIGRTIVQSTTRTVAGGLITVSPAELTRLDRYERVPIKYRREIISIEDAEVWVYVEN